MEDLAARVQSKLLEGLAHQQNGRLDDAEVAYRQVLALEPRHFDALHLSGVIAAQRQDSAGAATLISQAIAVNPQHAGAHYNLGYALEDLRQFAAAVASYDRAIALQSDHAVAYNNRGVALSALREHAAAVASFDRALALDPAYADALYNRGVALGELGQHRAAAQSFAAALQLAPDYPFLLGMWLYARLRVCDWDGLDGNLACLADNLAAGLAVTPPWPMLSLSGSGMLQRAAAETWARGKYAAAPTPPRRGPRGKIRLGYFSADFRIHPVALLAAGLFEVHDRGAFEVIAFSFGPDTGDDMRKRLEKTFDRFIDVANKTDAEITALARAEGIDIAIDLGGYTTDSRAGIFAGRAAPIQVNYLGYPGTMGADFIDYIVADEVVVPPSHRLFYAEKIAAVPIFQVNDRAGHGGEITLTRAACGLPETGFVYCCFNNSFKITPAVFDTWMGILKAVDGSVLFLFADTEEAKDNLRQSAVRAGVEATRLVFGGRVAANEYVARLRLSDLFLDTLPFNGGTTASDALWAGLPVLTQIGESFAGRMAASLLTAVGLEPLVTATPDAYAALAMELGRNPDRIAGLREKLAAQRLTSRLFDVSHFRRHIEEAYRQMIARSDAGLPPDHISVGIR